MQSSLWWCFSGQNGSTDGLGRRAIFTVVVFFWPERHHGRTREMYNLHCGSVFLAGPNGMCVSSQPNEADADYQGDCGSE